MYLRAGFDIAYRPLKPNTKQLLPSFIELLMKNNLLGAEMTALLKSNVIVTDGLKKSLHKVNT